MQVYYSASDSVRWGFFQTGERFQITLQSTAPYFGSFSPCPFTEPVEVERYSPMRSEFSDDEANQASAVNLAPRPADTWIGILLDELFPVDGVESVYFAKDGQNIEVWTLIPKRDLDVVRKIAGVQRAMMRLFVAQEGAPVFFFDFHTVYRESRPTDELVPLRALELPSTMR